MEKGDGGSGWSTMAGYVWGGRGAVSPNKDGFSSSLSIGFQSDAGEREWVDVGMNGGLWLGCVLCHRWVEVSLRC